MVNFIPEYDFILFYGNRLVIALVMRNKKGLCQCFTKCTWFAVLVQYQRWVCGRSIIQVGNFKCSFIHIRCLLAICIFKKTTKSTGHCPIIWPTLVPSTERKWLACELGGSIKHCNLFSHGWYSMQHPQQAIHPRVIEDPVRNDFLVCQY